MASSSPSTRGFAATPIRPAMRLRWRIVTILLAVSLLPILLLGGGAWVVFGRLLVDETLALEESAVENHASTIDLYLAERVRTLDLLARSHRLGELTDPARLADLFAALNRSYPDGFVDLGVIDGQGAHLAYVGPYDLADKNYADADWFHAVLAGGPYVSDVFLGYRKVPHCVIAVRAGDDHERWILRATINSDSFASLVRVGERGRSGDIFVVNQAGEYQTPPRLGAVLDRAPIALPTPHQGIRTTRVDADGREMIEVATWLNGGRWLLVVQRDEHEIRAPVDAALWRGAAVVSLSVLLVIATTVFATWHLTSRIDRADRARAKISQDFLRSAKLASLGELSAGFAHEINNPLAIISAEQTNLGDQITDLGLDAARQAGLLETIERCKRQVTRCGGITAKMLQFGRKGDRDQRPADAAPLLAEVVALMQRQAALRNVALELTVQPDLPRASLDATELEQVLVNLIGNSLAAIEGRGKITVTARRAGPDLEIAVTDTGCGIPHEQLESVFQPFFTTKPVGKGTGLGLSVCYGIVHSWGGTIDLDSEVGVGTTVTLRLPIADPPPDHPRSADSDHRATTLPSTAAPGVVP